MSKLILVIEDDETILYSLKEALQDRGFVVSLANTLAAAAARLKQGALPDLILLDLSLPDGDGLTFCQQQKETSGIPMIILTARDEEADMIKGLDLGADDYVTKPFKLGILLSRIHALLRRTGRDAASEDLLICQNVRLYRSRTQVLADDVLIPLTASEYRLLEYLMVNKNQTLTRNMLLEHLWDMGGEFVYDNTLSVTMKRLREKLGSNSQQIIQTIRGIGYRVEDSNEN